MRRFVAAAVLSCGLCTAAGAPRESMANALHIVALTLPHESEALTVRYMLAMWPIPIPPAATACTVEKATPAVIQHFAQLYAAHLSEAEIDAAVRFFESEEGQAVVAARLQYESRLYTDALHFRAPPMPAPLPASVREALERFGTTPAGRHFVTEPLHLRDAFRLEIWDVQNEALALCLEDPAVLNDG